eukprot:m.40763 g.40763  ORF g.40763 m.40763 type:complete len:375 (+) comp46036_c1_seq1:269-1393(+)
MVWWPISPARAPEFPLRAERGKFVRPRAGGRLCWFRMDDKTPDSVKNKLLEQLCEAARGGLLDECKRLVEKKGADVNRRDPILATPPVTHAAAWGHLNVVQYFLERGALLNILDPSGQTALHHAAMNGRVPVVTSLLRAGIPIDVKDRNGDTPLHLAVKSTRVEVVALCIQHNANVNVRNNEGWTPLHHASNELIVILLLKHGADPLAKGPSGLLPIEYKKDNACKKVLADAGSIVPVQIRRASSISGGVAPSLASTASALPDSSSQDSVSSAPQTPAESPRRPVSTSSLPMLKPVSEGRPPSPPTAQAPASPAAGAPAAQAKIKKPAPPPPARRTSTGSSAKSLPPPTLNPFNEEDPDTDTAELEGTYVNPFA